MIDYGDAVRDGVATGFGMLWSAIVASPWLVILVAGIVAGALWLQLTPARKRRR